MNPSESPIQVSTQNLGKTASSAGRLSQPSSKGPCTSGAVLDWKSHGQRRFAIETDAESTVQTCHLPSANTDGADTRRGVGRVVHA
jgi:hypothetical protein